MPPTTVPASNIVNRVHHSEVFSFRNMFIQDGLGGQEVRSGWRGVSPPQCQQEDS